MFADVGEPQRPRVRDQLAQHAASSRQSADVLAFGLVDPDREEALQLCAGGVQHAQRRVAGAGELACGLEHAVEHHLEVELGEHAAGEVQNASGGSIHQRAPAQGDVRRCFLLNAIAGGLLSAAWPATAEHFPSRLRPLKLVANVA